MDTEVPGDENKTIDTDEADTTQFEIEQCAERIVIQCVVCRQCSVGNIMNHQNQEHRKYSQEFDI